MSIPHLSESCCLRGFLQLNLRVFQLEPIRETLIGDFDGDLSAKPRVASFIDFAHLACADRARISYGPSLSPAGRGVRFSLSSTGSGAYHGQYGSYSPGRVRASRALAAEVQRTEGGRVISRSPPRAEVQDGYHWLQWSACVPIRRLGGGGSVVT